MEENELVSIITAAYNCGDTIDKTYDSIKRQTYIFWEWIIVEDNSSDNSFECISKLIKNDKRVRLYRTQRNSGSAVARNIGLKKSDGRYITFLDADDLLDDSYIENQLAFMKLNGPIVSSGYRRKTEKTCTVFIPSQIITYKKELCGNDLSCLTTMFDKTIIGERYFPENLLKREDYVFWLNILKDGFVAKGNPSVLATYVIHSGSKSSNKIKLIKYQYIVYHKTQGFNWLKSWFYVIKWAFYGRKKYKNVR